MIPMAVSQLDSCWQFSQGKSRIHDKLNTEAKCTEKMLQRMHDTFKHFRDWILEKCCVLMHSFLNFTSPYLDPHGHFRAGWREGKCDRGEAREETESSLNWLQLKYLLQILQKHINM